MKKTIAILVLLAGGAFGQVAQPPRDLVVRFEEAKGRAEKYAAEFRATYERLNVAEKARAGKEALRDLKDKAIATSKKATEAIVEAVSCAAAGKALRTQEEWERFLSWLRKIEEDLKWESQDPQKKKRAAPKRAAQFSTQYSDFLKKVRILCCAIIDA